VPEKGSVVLGDPGGGLANFLGSPGRETVTVGRGLFGTARTGGGKNKTPGNPLGKKRTKERSSQCALGTGWFLHSGGEREWDPRLQGKQGPRRKKKENLLQNNFCFQDPLKTWKKKPFQEICGGSQKNTI